MRKCNCPNCNASLDIDDNNRDFAFCQYCGTKIMLDDYRSTQRIVDEAKIKQAEYDREIRLKELSLQEEQNKQQQKTKKLLTKIWLIVTVIIGLICLVTYFNDPVEAGLILFYVGGPIIGGGGYFVFIHQPEKEAEKKMLADGNIKFPTSVFPYSEKTYIVVESAIRSAGFTNVTTVNLHDVTIGLLQKPNLVESITVRGEQITSGGKIYPPETPIIISYHGK